MDTRSLPLVLSTIAVLASSPRASAGWWSDDEWHIRSPLGHTPHLTGAIRGYKLTSTHGRQVTVLLPRPAALDGTLALPAGDWAELTLLLDGPVTLELGGVQVTLDLDALTVPLADPSASEIHLEWTLPEDLTARLERGERSETLSHQLGLALQDGGLAMP